MKRTIRVLLTGVGSPAAPGVIKSLRSSSDFQFHIAGIDCNPDSAGFRFVDKPIVGPRAEDEAFIPFVIEACRQEGIDIVFSLVTGELFKLASSVQAFGQIGTKLLISEAQTIRQTIHKGVLYERLSSMGIAVPEFRKVSDRDSFKQALLDLGYPHNPVCFKPVVSDGSRGFHILDVSVDRHRLLFQEKPNSAYISYNELLEVLDGHTEQTGQPVLPELLVMEYMPYEEYSVDILANRGKVVVCVPRLREMTAGGITTKSLIRNEPDITLYAADIVEKLGLHGIVGVQVRRDTSRKPKIVEINPRIQGTIVHCTAAGVNIPLLAVKQALGIDYTEQELEVRWGTRMVRYWEEVYYDADGSSYAL